MFHNCCQGGSELTYPTPTLSWDGWRYIRLTSKPVPSKIYFIIKNYRQSWITKPLIKASIFTECFLLVLNFIFVFSMFLFDNFFQQKILNQGVGFVFEDVYCSAKTLFTFFILLSCVVKWFLYFYHVLWKCDFYYYH